MSLNDARMFVAKMKDDQIFRKQVLDTAGPESLSAFLLAHDFDFDQRELTAAMAECMDQLEQQM